MKIIKTEFKNELQYFLVRSKNRDENFVFYIYHRNLGIDLNYRYTIFQSALLNTAF